MNKMQVIDFDTHFSDMLAQWVEENRGKYRNADALEEASSEVYFSFMEKPAPWLDGLSPVAYFAQFESAEDLIALMKQYFIADVPLPDLLPERLAELRDEKALLALCLDKEAPCGARMTGIEILREIDSTLPMVDFIRWQVERNDEDDILDNALESLRQMGETVKKPCLIAFRAADEAGKEALLDVLCDYPGEEEVFRFALNGFRTCKDKRALYAGYLAKLEDDRALEYLLDVAEDDDVCYTDFVEIRSAIERLGSDAPVRDWSDDPTYQAFKRVQRSQLKKLKQ